MPQTSLDERKVMVGMTRYQRLMHGHIMDGLSREYSTWRAEREQSVAAQATPKGAAEQLAEFMREGLRENRDKLQTLKQQNDAFKRSYSQSEDEGERRQRILDYAAQLGATPRQLRGDKKAFARYFGFEAMMDRFRRRFGETQSEIVFQLNRLGVLAACCLAGFDPSEVRSEDPKG